MGPAIVGNNALPRAAVGAARGAEAAASVVTGTVSEAAGALSVDRTAFSSLFQQGMAGTRDALRAAGAPSTWKPSSSLSEQSVQIGSDLMRFARSAGSERSADGEKALDHLRRAYSSLSQATEAGLKAVSNPESRTEGPAGLKILHGKVREYCSSAVDQAERSSSPMEAAKGYAEAIRALLPVAAITGEQLRMSERPRMETLRPQAGEQAGVPGPQTPSFRVEGERRLQVTPPAGRHTDMEKSVHSACIEIGKEVGYDFSRFSVRAVSAAGSSTPMAITTQYSASRLKGQDPSARPQIDVNPELVEKCGGLQQCSRFILLHELSHELRDSREMLTGKAFDALQTRSKSLARQLGASDSIRVGSILDEAAVDGSAIALGLEQQRLGRTPGERRQAMAEAWLQAEKGTESTIAASGPAFEAVHRARQYATGYALAAGEWASPEAKNSFMNELAGIGRRFQEAAGRVLSAEGTRQLFDAAIDASTLGLATLDQASSAAAMRDPAMLMKSFRAAESVRDYVASAVACFGTKASPELRTWLPGGEQFNAMSVKYKKFGDLPLEQMQQEAFSGIAQALESASGRLFGGQEERVDAILNFTKGLYR